MMGHINNLLLGMVRKDHQDAGVTKVLEMAGFPEAQYQSETIYPEEEFQALYGAVKEFYGGIDDDSAQKAFADYFMEVSPKMFPAFFEKGRNVAGLLKMVPIIHKQFPSAASTAEFTEKLWLIEEEKNRVLFKYSSPNQLCRVLIYVSEGVLKYYKQTGTVTETQCALKGAPHCLVEVQF